MQFHNLLASMVSVKKLTVNLIKDNICDEITFAAFKIFFFVILVWLKCGYIWISVLNLVSCASWLYRLFYIKFGKFSAIIASNIFFLTYFLFCFWDSYYTYVGTVDGVSHSETLRSFCFFNFFFPVTNRVIPIDLFSSLLILPPNVFAHKTLKWICFFFFFFYFQF